MTEYSSLGIVLYLLSHVIPLVFFCFFCPFSVVPNSLKCLETFLTYDFFYGLACIGVI